MTSLFDEVGGEGAALDEGPFGGGPEDFRGGRDPEDRLRSRPLRLSPAAGEHFNFDREFRRRRFCKLRLSEFLRPVRVVDEEIVVGKV